MLENLLEFLIVSIFDPASFIIKLVFKHLPVSKAACHVDQEGLLMVLEEQERSPLGISFLLLQILTLVCCLVEVFADCFP